MRGAIIGVHELAAAFECRRDLFERIPEHRGPAFAARETAGAYVPIPKAIAAAFEDEGQPLLAFAQCVGLLADPHEQAALDSDHEQDCGEQHGQRQ